MEKFKDDLAELLATHLPESDEQFAEMVIVLAKMTGGVISFRVQHPIALGAILMTAKEAMHEGAMDGAQRMRLDWINNVKTTRG